MSVGKPQNVIELKQRSDQTFITSHPSCWEHGLVFCLFLNDLFHFISKIVCVDILLSSSEH